MVIIQMQQQQKDKTKQLTMIRSPLPLSKFERLWKLDPRVYVYGEKFYAAWLSDDILICCRHSRHILNVNKQFCMIERGQQ